MIEIVVQLYLSQVNNMGKVPKMFSIQSEIEHMIKNKEKFIKKLGKPTYDRLLKKLKDAK